MISTSEAFAAAIGGTSRRFRARLLENGTELGGEIRRVTVRTGSCGASVFTPGSVFSSYAEITVDGGVPDLEGKALELQLGVLLPGDSYEYLTLGRFTAGRPSISANETAFTALGSIAAYFTDAFAPPGETTVANVIAALSAQTGVNIVLRGLNAAGTIEKDLTGLTCRQVLGVVAGLLGGYAAERNDGAVILARFSAMETTAADGSRMTALPVFGSWDAAITGVRVRVPADGEHAETVYESGTPNLERTDAYMTEALFPAYAANLTGLTYCPGTVKLALGDPRLEPWDVLAVTAGTGRTRLLPCMNITHSFDGGLATEIRAPDLPEGTAVLGTTGAALRALQDDTAELKVRVFTEKTAREQAVEALSESLSSLSGMYQSSETAAGGTVRYLHDRPTIAASAVVLKLTASALGISTDGGATWSQGWDFVTGTAIANVLSANGINADWINTGSIRSSNGNTSLNLSSGEFLFGRNGSSYGYLANGQLLYRKENAGGDQSAGVYLHPWLGTGDDGLVALISETDGDLGTQNVPYFAAGIARGAGGGFEPGYVLNNGLNPDGYSERNIFYGSTRFVGPIDAARLLWRNSDQTSFAAATLTLGDLLDYPGNYNGFVVNCHQINSNHASPFRIVTRILDMKDYSLYDDDTGLPITARLNVTDTSIGSSWEIIVRQRVFTFDRVNGTIGISTGYYGNNGTGGNQSVTTMVPISIYGLNL